MKIFVAILLSLLLQDSIDSGSLPSDAKQLLSQHAKAVAKLEKQLYVDLQKLMEQHMKKLDLDAANAINNVLNDSKPSLSYDAACGNWDFLGVNQQKINKFVFQSDGSIRAENSYKTANWSRLDPKTIIFRYSDADGVSTIVFHVQEDPDTLKGFNSANGRVRYLRRPR